MNGNRIAELKNRQPVRQLARVIAWQWVDDCESILATGGKPQRLSLGGTQRVVDNAANLRRTPSLRAQKIIAQAAVAQALGILKTNREKYAATIAHFDSRKAEIYQPVVIAWGGGVDSTAMIIGMLARGERIDLVLFADTGSERPGTYAHVALFMAWLQMRGIQVEVVRYQVSDSKHWPPYTTLGENLLTNATLPSIAFGFKSCSLKWKVVPQNKYCDAWFLAQRCWEQGGRVIKCIGYDCSPADQKRYADVDNVNDPKYEYRYPLREFGWKRADCERAIAAAGLPVPPKSSCYFCSAMHEEEVDELPVAQLRVLVLMEARATPRLEGWMDQAQLDLSHERRLAKWERKCAQAKKKGKTAPKMPRRMIAGKDGVQGLWRRGNKGTRTGKPKPARITDYIRAKALLPADEIDHIWNNAPTELIRFQKEFAEGGHDNPLADWLTKFNAVAQRRDEPDFQEAAGTPRAALAA